MALSSVAAVLAAARAEARPCVALAYGPAAAARIGGAPNLAGDIDWPHRDGRPLAFLAQLDCAALGAAGSPSWFPEHGMLFLFYDLIEQPWGYDPDDRGGWAVIYDERGPAQAGRAVPEGVIDEPDGLPIETGLIGRPAMSIPAGRLVVDTDDAATRQAINDALDAEMRAPFSNGARHQIGGYPHPIQGDEMEWECELASNGVNCGSGDAYRSPRGLALRAGADDWRLLMQIDTDETYGLFWVDDGRLYFWIREDDARAGRWDAAWVILQCH